MGKVYYNQADSRWANHPYPAYPGYETMTCKTSGCGATCGAMIVSSCRETIYPDAMCDIARENGHRVPGGTADSFFPFLAERWGIEMKRVYSSYEAHQACKEGYFVVICCRNGLWTTSGHFILAVGANDTEIEIYDPYLYNGKFNKSGRQGLVRMEGMSAWVNIDKFKANSNAQRFFAFKVGLENTQPVEQPKEEIETKVAWVNTNKSNLNVRSTPNGTVVGSLPKGTQVLVYELQNGWARIGNNKWVSNTYLRYEETAPVQPAIPSTVGQTRRFKAFTYLWSNPDLTGTRYDYKAKTEVRIVENVSTSVDKITVVKTNRTAYVSTSAYEGSTTTTSKPVSKPASTVGQTKTLKSNTTFWSKPDLTGTRYNYLAGTKVKILENTSSSVDKITAIKTGRVAYVSNKAYK